MERKNTYLDEDRLVRYLSTKLHIKSALLDDMSPALQKLMMIHSMVENTDGDLDKMIIEASTIEDVKLRRWFRKGILAQMYGVNEYDKEDGKPYISAANNHCALLQIPGETIILNADGTLRPTAYPVKLLDATASRWGWVTKEKGPDNYKRGLFSLEGYEMLPCEFDDIEIGDYDEPAVSFAGYRFRLIPVSNIKNATENQKTELKEMSKSEILYCTGSGFVFIFDEAGAESESMVLLMPGVRVTHEYAERNGVISSSSVAASKEEAIQRLRNNMKQFIMKLNCDIKK